MPRRDLSIFEYDWFLIGVFEFLFAELGDVFGDMLAFHSFYKLVIESYSGLLLFVERLLFLLTRSDRLLGFLLLTNFTSIFLDLFAVEWFYMERAFRFLHSGSQ